MIESPHTAVIMATLSFGAGYGFFKKGLFSFFRLFVLLFALYPLYQGVQGTTYLICLGAFFFGIAYPRLQFIRYFDVRDWLPTFTYSRKPKPQEHKNHSYSQVEKQAQFEAEQRARAEAARKAREAKEQKAQQEQARQQKEEQSHSRQHFSGTHQKSQSQERIEHKVDRRTPQEVLGLQGHYTQEDVKRAYRKLASKYHPDRWQNEPEHIRAMMSAEMKKVNWAYRLLS